MSRDEAEKRSDSGLDDGIASSSTTISSLSGNKSTSGKYRVEFSENSNLASIIQIHNLMMNDRNNIIQEYTFAIRITPIGRCDKKVRVFRPPQDSDLQKMFPKSSFGGNKFSYLFDEKGVPRWRAQGGESRSMLVCFKGNVDEIHKITPLVSLNIKRHKLQYKAEQYLGNPIDSRLDTVLEVLNEEPEFNPSILGEVKHHLKVGNLRYVVYKEVHPYLPAIERLQKKLGKWKNGWFHSSTSDLPGSPLFKFMKRARNFPEISDKLVEELALYLSPPGTTPTSQVDKRDVLNLSSEGTQGVQVPHNISNLSDKGDKGKGKGEKVELVINERQGSNEEKKESEIVNKTKNKPSNNKDPPKSTMTTPSNESPELHKGNKSSSDLDHASSESEESLDDTNTTPKFTVPLPEKLSKLRGDVEVNVSIRVYFEKCPESEMKRVQQDLIDFLNDNKGGLECKRRDNYVEVNLTEELHEVRMIAEIIFLNESLENEEWSCTRVEIVSSL